VLKDTSAHLQHFFARAIGHLVRDDRLIGVRKHYYFRPAENGFDAWDVDHLIELSRSFPVHEIDVASIADVDSVYWIGADASAPTVRILVKHMKLVEKVDLGYPIILGADARVMDGMHRVAKALLEGLPTVLAVRFDVQPDADFKNIQPGDLPYE
jgi:hypothetical protein